VLNYSIINMGLKELKSKNKDSNDIYTITDLIELAKNIDNFRFILYDLSETAEGLKNGEIVDYFDGTNGIWLGSGFDSQFVYDVNSSLSTPFTISNDEALIMVKDGIGYEIKSIRE
ncbi:MAG: hypothetical protein IKE70_04010, partial [Bacilli bacterium]|nr:hypothetical protein [Bacilli bacterium]